LATVLTDAAVRRLKPTGKRRAVRDAASRSLYLLIQPSSYKSWVMWYRQPGGKLIKLTLGAFDPDASHNDDEQPRIGMPLSLVAARRLAAQINRDRAFGRNPLLTRSSDSSFAACAKTFIREHAQVRTRQWQDTARMLGFDPVHLELIPNGLAQRWGNRDVGTITGHDVHGVVDEARRLGIPGKARKNGGASDPRGRAMSRCLSKLFSWLVEQRRITINPSVGVYCPPPPRSRERVLTSDEIRLLWQATERGGALDQAARLLLLTGCRLNEISRLQWSEVTEDGAAIDLPGSRTKNHRQHLVPLAPVARAIIAERPRIVGCDFIFSTNGRTPISGWSRWKETIDAKLGIPPWKIHDARRTCATGLAQIGIQPHIIEAVLDHVSGAKAGVAGVYNRFSYSSEKREALEQWATYVAAIIASPNVIRLRKRRR
jgi:integrase